MAYDDFMYQNMQLKCLVPLFAILANCNPLLRRNQVDVYIKGEVVDSLAQGSNLLPAYLKYHKPCK